MLLVSGVNRGWNNCTGGQFRFICIPCPRLGYPLARETEPGHGTFVARQVTAGYLECALHAPWNRVTNAVL
jgi:hypothetical protein